MPAYVQWFDQPGEPTGAAGDLLDVTYQQVRSLSHSDTEAEALTLQVFHRTRQPLPAWLLRQPTLTRLQILITSVVIAHRRDSTPAHTYPAGHELHTADL